MQIESGCAVVRQARLKAVVGAFLIGCAVLVVNGSGVPAEASQEEKQKHTEATKHEQGHSGGAAPEGDRCDRTRTISRGGAGYLTNDLPGCPNKGGLLSAQLPDTGRRKISDPKYGLLRGEKGDDEVRGSSTGDEIYGGDGNDVIYGGSGGDFLVGNQDDDVIHGGAGNDYVLSGAEGEDAIYGEDGNDDLGGDPGEDVLYGGDGNDFLDGRDHRLSDNQPDELYCGKGRDQYVAGSLDFVDSSCEEAAPYPLVDTGGPPLILLAGAVLLLGSGLLVMSRYVVRRA